jgi:FAD-dependent urate hydroxylase
MSTSSSMPFAPSSTSVEPSLRGDADHGGMARNHRILVVGGGIAGLAVGRSLHQVGIEVDVVERQSSWERGGTGIYLPANGIRALGTLGVVDRLIDIGHIVHSQVVCAPDGSVVAEVDLDAIWNGTGVCLAMLREDLHRALRDGFPAALRMGTSVTEIEAQQGGLDVAFDDGTSKSYDAVVGADGVRSWLRHRFFSGVDQAYSGETYWRAVVPCPNGLHTWTAWLPEGGVFLLLPIGDGKAYCAAGTLTEAAFSDPVAGRRERLRARYAGLGRAAEDALESLPPDEDIHFGATETVFADPPVCGRAVLVGDAAHANAPSMAEGASMAVEDALVLAEELARTADVDAALGRYAARRLPRTRHVRDQTAARSQALALPVEVRLEFARSAFDSMTRAAFEPLKLQP